MRKRILKIYSIGILVVFFSVITPVGAAILEDNSNPVSPSTSSTPAALLGIQLQDTSENLKTAKWELEWLVFAKNKVLEEKSNLEKMDISSVAESVKEKIAKLAQAINEIDNLSATNEISIVDQSVKSIEKLNYEVRRERNLKYVEVLGAMDEFLDKDNIASTIIRRALNKIDRDYESESMYKRNPIDDLLEIISRSPKIKKEEIEKSIKSSIQYLEKIKNDQAIKKMLDNKRNHLMKFLSDLSVELDKEIGYQESSVVNYSKAQNTIASELDKKYDYQSKIDVQLSYAIYGMVLVLLIMFLSLKWFSDTVTLEIIKKRSLIEFVGMAFMLIIIMILGTGNKLDNQTMGTLLGTIAGYIFGRVGGAKQEDASTTQAATTSPPGKS